MSLTKSEHKQTESAQHDKINNVHLNWSFFHPNFVFCFNETNVKKQSEKCEFI